MCCTKLRARLVSIPSRATRFATPKPSRTCSKTCGVPAAASPPHPTQPPHSLLGSCARPSQPGARQKKLRRHLAPPRRRLPFTPSPENTCCARNAAPTPRRAPDDTKPAPGAQPDPPPQLGAWQQNKERAPRFSRRHLPLRPLDHVPEVAVAPPSSLPIKQTTPNALVKTLIRCFQTTMQTFSAERKARPVPRPNASGGPRCGRAPFCPGTRAALEHPQAPDKGAPPSFHHAGSGCVLIFERGLVVSAAGSREGGLVGGFRAGERRSFFGSEKSLSWGAILARVRTEEGPVAEKSCTRLSGATSCPDNVASV